MAKSIFLEVEFYAFVAFSLVFPVTILAGLLLKKAIARSTVLMFGILLIVLSGFSFIFLGHLATLARHTPSLFDDDIFSSALSVALYLIPVVFAGIGTNLVSHILILHLSEAEKQYDRQHPENR